MANVLSLLQSGYDIYEGRETALDTDKPEDQRFMGVVQGVGSTAELVGDAAEAGGGFLGGETGAALSEAGELLGPAGAVLGAGVLGYQVGTALDERFHLSDHASDAMVGSMDSRVWNQSHEVRQNDRGSAGIAAANDQWWQTETANVQEQMADATARARIAGAMHWAL
jgi:hypothetical protein